MGKPFENLITDFSGGITDDPRDDRKNVAQMVTNFNALTNKHRLIPYRNSESGDSSASTRQNQAFCIAKLNSTTYALYGLGVSSGTGKAEVSYKALTTGAANDLDDDSWNNTSNYFSAAGTTSFNLFVYYQRTGYIYGARAGTHIWRYDPDGGDAWADSHQALTYANLAQGIVHSKDDVLYIPYDNKLAKNDNGSWTTAALTLPEHLYITSICEYGNYLAIGCAPLSGYGNSIVYLWDRDSSSATISESIDWGEGVLKVLEEVDGELIGISLCSSGNRFNDRVIFRVLQLTKALKFKELLTTATTTQLPIFKQKIDNRLYFMMSTSLYGATREGVWSVGRTPGGPFTLFHERTPNNDTALTSGVLKGFYIVADYLFQSYIDNGTYALSKTNDSASYATSIYETKILNEGDSSLKKDLMGASVMTEYMPANGQIVLKYKKDEETSFTTIFTNTTDSSISYSAVNIESSGAALPKGYKEITFRIESTGGAVVTGLHYKGEIVDKRPY